jgi:hypothetical protein
LDEFARVQQPSVDHPSAGVDDNIDYEVGCFAHTHGFQQGVRSVDYFVDLWNGKWLIAAS